MGGKTFANAVTFLIGILLLFLFFPLYELNYLNQAPLQIIYLGFCLLLIVKGGFG